MSTEDHDRLEISNFSVTAEGDRFFVDVYVMSTDIIPEDVLRRDIPKLLGKEARLEHIIPELEPYSIVGETLKVWWDEAANMPVARIEVYGDSDVSLQLRKDLLHDQELPIAERKYKGVSIGILKYSKEGRIIKILPREISFTTNPVCELCTVQQIYEKISVGQYNMSENIQLGILQASFDKNIEIMKENFSAQLALKDKEVSNLNEKIERKNSEYSAAKEVYETKISNQESIILEKDKKITEITVELNSKNKEITDAKEATRVAEITPLVDDILTVASFSRDSERYKAEHEKLMQKKKKDLLDILVYQKRDVDIYSQMGPSFGTPIQGLPISANARDFNPNGVNRVELTKEQARKVL